MLNIEINGELIDLPENASLEIEDSNPVFNERGSQSLPLTVPATGRNRRLLKYVDLLHSTDAPDAPGTMATVSCKSYCRRALVNITSASRRNGITFNLGFDNSISYDKWQNKQLRELSGLPVVEMPVPELLSWLQRNGFGQPMDSGLAHFPVVVSKSNIGSDENKTYVYEVLNSAGALSNSTGSMKFRQVINNVMTTVTAPAGYAVSPFLKVWRLLELIFADLGVSITENPLKSDPDLERLVILNNTMDGVATGRLDYADLLPDCSVDEFLNALWVKFGLVYHVDDNTGTVRLRLVKDILTHSPQHDFDSEISDFANIIYETPQYVKLSAATSIDGAEPPCSRWEDFQSGAPRTIIHGYGVDRWMGGEAGLRLAGIDADSKTKELLGVEIITGKWYRLDAENNQPRCSGSSFFEWNPQPEGMDAFELTGQDECVPIEFTDTGYQDAGLFPRHELRDYCPMYLFGARHRHSVLRGTSADEAEADEDTPLAFMFAFNGIGRLSPEMVSLDRLGLPDDAPKPRLTLYFQFSDGLFANYWREFDEMIRHSHRVAEVPARLNTHSLRALDMLEPVRLSGVLCLLNSLTYSLPDTNPMAVDLKLNVIQTQGEYDITAEQRPAPVQFSLSHLEWRLLNTNQTEFLNSFNKSEIARIYRDELGYPDYFDGVYYHFIIADSVVFNELRGNTSWKNGPSNLLPQTEIVTQTVEGVMAAFNVYRYKTTNRDIPSTWQRELEPLDRDYTAPSSTVSFKATYVPVLIPD